MQKLVILALCLVLTVSLSTGCRKVKTPATTSLKVYDQTAPVPEIKVDENRKVSLPHDYPQNIVPLYEGGKILAASKREDTKNNAYFFVSFSLDKDVEEVAAYYQAYFKDVKDVHKTQLDKSFNFSGTKQDKLFTVAFLPGKVNGKALTVVTVTVYPKQ